MLPARQSPEPAPRNPSQSAGLRESVWSVFPRLWVIYFILYAALYAAGLGFVLWYEAARLAHPGVYDLIYAAILKQAVVGGGAAITSFTITEGGRLTVVLAKIVELNYLRPKIERIRAETRAEAARKIEEWYQRRLEAEAKGEPFDEPPPDLTAP